MAVLSYVGFSGAEHGTVGSAVSQGDSPALCLPPWRALSGSNCVAAAAQFATVWRSAAQRATCQGAEGGAWSVNVATPAAVLVGNAGQGAAAASAAAPTEWIG